MLRRTRTPVGGELRFSLSMLRHTKGRAALRARSSTRTERNACKQRRTLRCPARAKGNGAIEMQTLRLETDTDGIATITFDEAGSPVNTMTLQWQHDLAEVVSQLERDKERLRGVLLVSAKSTFFAGAELKSVLQLKAEDAGECFRRIEALKKSFRRLETLGRPVVALLNGAALGGGWEVALAAHARFALDDPKIRFGTPEVTLGLIPGATGITKTVRLLGLTAAQPYLLEGRLFGPREALEVGFVQGLAESVEGLRSMALEWIGTHPAALQPWDR